MGKNLLLFITAIILIGCNSNGNGLLDEDLETKKQRLTEKRAELASLQQEVNELIDEIALLDPSLQESARLVNTLDILPRTFERYYVLQGAVTADEIVNVVSEVPGRILSVQVKEGDPVRAGQLIARLDLEGLSKQMEEVNTALTLAKDVFARQERLWAQKIGSEIQYLQAKNNVERLEKSMETIKFQMTKSYIYAPISGIVDAEGIKSGEVASPGMPIVRILNTSRLKVVIDLPERYLAGIRKGEDVSIEYPSLQTVGTGKVSLLGRTIDPANRTLKVEIAPKGSVAMLKPNLLAEVKLKELSMDAVLVVPVEYVLQDVSNQNFVYLAVTSETGETRVKKQYVETGEAYNGEIVALKGLSAGDKLITKGARNVSDGELVNVEENRAPINE